ncbi:MAG: GIY-YIG nuclease family protein [Anaerolineae bacterium]|nr:GIY-YIG nuclease family protein [Anaerolineae bacterium]
MADHPTIEIRTVHTMDELNTISRIEMDVWGMPAEEAAPGNIMKAIIINGGIAHGAFDGARMIGMSLAFPGVRAGRRYLWSHMAGVLKAYQRQGIGLNIKLAQREWALAQSYDEMRWTFDPIQRGNARFNLHLLGCYTHTYYENHYGQMNDSINVPAPTDRLEAVWRLKDARVKALAAGGAPKPYGGDIADEALILRMGDASTPLTASDVFAALQDDPLFIEIPAGGLSSLPRDQVLNWRLALRAALQRAFAQGYRAVDLVERDGRAFYLLRPQDRYFLYVLECADHSLYTGIAADIRKRLAQHNAGRGAAYTSTRRPLRLLAAWQFTSRGAALKAEAAFKGQSRAQKLAVIESSAPFREGTRVETAT